MQQDEVKSRYTIVGTMVLDNISSITSGARKKRIEFYHANGPFPTKRFFGEKNVLTHDPMVFSKPPFFCKKSIQKSQVFGILFLLHSRSRAGCHMPNFEEPPPPGKIWLTDKVAWDEPTGPKKKWRVDKLLSKNDSAMKS